MFFKQQIKEFPRRIRRGLIEANPKEIATVAESDDFRGEFAAASLKHCISYTFY